MRILITGGRDFADAKLLNAALDRLHSEAPITCMIHGAAKGADALAGQWANANSIEEIACPANWKQHGSSTEEPLDRSEIS